MACSGRMAPVPASTSVSSRRGTWMALTRDQDTVVAVWARLLCTVEEPRQETLTIELSLATVARMMTSWKLGGGREIDYDAIFSNRGQSHFHREQTVYYAKVFEKDLGRGLEILSDILINSRLDQSAVQRERDVIIREMEEVNKKQEEVGLDAPAFTFAFSAASSCRPPGDPHDAEHLTKTCKALFQGPPPRLAGRSPRRNTRALKTLRQSKGQGPIHSELHA